MVDAWHEAFTGYTIWQAACELDERKDTPLTKAAVDAALDDWLSLKGHAIHCEIEFQQICDAEEHADTCNDCKARLAEEAHKSAKEGRGN